jgi:RsiW-degrading membrane proteinase PrsW (M82 family)
VIALVVALLPVTMFLAILVVGDSFKLVPRVTLARALAAGVAAAGVTLVLHTWLLAHGVVEILTLKRYVAPLVEESLKAACLIYLLRRGRIGFLVDAAIVGFGVGTGFALVENVHYLRTLTGAPIWVWVARGFGAALLHASTACIVAVTGKALADRYPAQARFAMAPGWLLAVALHAVYNRALVSPILAAAFLLTIVPLIVMAVFDRSEKLTREWVGDGLDLDVELLALIRSSHFGATRLGRYLTELTTRFPGPVVADMFCLLQLELELGIRVKGMLMAREAGLDVPVDDEVRARLAERTYLQETIGPTGLLALRPLQVTTARDEWHRYLLHHASPRAPWRRRKPIT